MSLHHIVPKSRWWYKWRDKNVIYLEETTHAHLHCIFWNASPLQQLKEILYFDSPKNNKFFEISFEISSLTNHQIIDTIYKKNIIQNPQKLFLPVLHKSKKPKIILSSFNDFFNKKSTEEKILYILEINSKSLKNKFQTKIKNIIC